MTNYEKGRQLEKKVLDYFRYHGFVGMRAAQSKGPYDVIVSPPLSISNQLSLHIQIGPKSKRQLYDLFNIAQGHHGMKAHLYKADKKEPKISLLSCDNYTSLQEFLSSCYGVNLATPWKPTLKYQAIEDREARKTKK